jgi:hypothetical protein
VLLAPPLAEHFSVALPRQVSSAEQTPSTQPWTLLNTSRVLQEEGIALLRLPFSEQFASQSSAGWPWQVVSF